MSSVLDPPEQLAQTKATDHEVSGTPRIRLAYVDTLRALACLWVIVYHARILWTHNKLALGIAIADRILNAGDLGVDLFLVLSGFCLTLPLLRKQHERSARIEYGAWMNRRAWRILPPYYLALALCSVALAFPLLAAQMIRPTTLIDWPLHILMMQNLNTDSAQSIIGSFWSLALEFQLYALFPLFLLILRRTGRRGLVAIPIVVSLVWGVFCLHKVGVWPAAIGTTIQWYYAVPGRAVEFTLGMVAAACIVRPRGRQHLLGLCLAITLIPVCIWLYSEQARTVMQYAHISPLGIKSVVAGIAFSGLLVALRPFDDQIHRFRIVRPLYLFGGISYSAYLLQEPLLRYSVPLIAHLQHGADMHAHTFLLTIGLWIAAFLVPLTWLYYRFAEKPFLKGAPYWLAARSSNY